VGSYPSTRAARARFQLDLCNLFDSAQIKRGLELINSARTVDDLARLEFAKLVNGHNYSYA
jgi:hypothetical protein